MTLKVSSGQSTPEGCTINALQICNVQILQLASVDQTSVAFHEIFQFSINCEFLMLYGTGPRLKIDLIHLSHPYYL